MTIMKNCDVLKHTSMHLFIGNGFQVLGSGDFLEGKIPPTGKILVECISE